VTQIIKLVVHPTKIIPNPKINRNRNHHISNSKSSMAMEQDNMETIQNIKTIDKGKTSQVAAIKLLKQ